MMTNWDKALQYQEQYKNGWTVGSAEKENERFINSIEGKIIRLKEEFNSLVTTTISTDSFKTFLDILTKIFSVVNKIVDGFDDLGLSAPLMIGVISSMSKTIKALGTGTPLTMTLGNGIMSIYSKLGGQIQQTTQSTQDGENAQQGYRVSLTNTANASILASVKTGLLTTAMTLLNTVITGVAIGGMMLLVKAVMDYVNANEIAHEKIAESIEVTKTTISSYEKQKSALSELAKEYDTLSNKSNKSNEELERYNVLKKEIGELAPDLVLGTDATGNPILALNGSLEDYIANLDKVIEREKKLLMNQQNSLASKSREELKKINRTSERNANFSNMVDYSDAWDDSTPIGNSVRIKNARDGADEYIKIYEKRNKRINDLNVQLVESFEKFSAIEMEQQQSVFNKLSDENRFKGFNKLNDETKNAMQTLIGSFNWGSSVVKTASGQNQFVKNFDALSDKIGENSEKLKKWNEILINSNEAWQSTGDLDQYQKDIIGIAEEIAKLTGTNVRDWIVGLTNELEGGLDESAINLNNYLKSYKKSYSDILANDEIAIKLGVEYDATSELLEDLTAPGQTYESMVNWLVKVNKGEIDYSNNLPYQVKTMIAGALDGGTKLKDYETRMIMKVASVIQSNGELDDKTFGLITRMLNGQLSEAEMKVDIKLPDGQVLNSDLVRIINNINKNKDKNIEVSVELNEDKLNEDLELLLEGDGNKELRINLKTAIEENDYETFNTLLKDVPIEKQVDIVTSFIEYGGMSTDEVEEFIETLPPEVQTLVKIIIDDGGVDESILNTQEVQTILVEISDEGTYEKVHNLIGVLDKLDIDKKLKIDIIGNVAKGNTEGILNALDSIKDLPKEQKMQIISNISSVMAGMEGLDREKIREKVLQITATDNASEKVDGVNKKPVKDKHLTIWVSVKNALKKAADWVNGLFTDNAVGEYTNISTTPEEADMGVKVNRSLSNVSTTPEIKTASDENNTLNTSMSNGISNFTSKALKSFAQIGSSITLPTSINISKNALKSIEYSIELFQELDYRIQSVNNNLDLLDVKMENSTGTERIKYLQKQNSLYEEQAKLQKELYDGLSKEKDVIKNKLKTYGFKFDNQENLVEYEEILISLNEQVDKLEKSSSKSGSNTKLDNLRDKLDTVNKLTQEYLQIQEQDLNGAEKEWENLQNSIKENNDEIERLELEDKLYKFKNSITELSNQYDIWGDKIDLIDTKLNNSLEVDKVSLMKEKLEALNKQLEIQDKTLSSLKNQLPAYQKTLGKYNVEFDSSGNIQNMSSVLNKYQNSEDLEKINDLIKEYNDLIGDAIPNAEKEYANLNNTIQDVYDTQLETIEDIEGKITDVIKDQIDKRKELIQKQYDSEIDLLNKRKEEYNKTKETNDYYKDLEEAQTEINNIQKKINTISLDDSLEGRSKLNSYLEELKDAQDKYNDLVANRTDTIINDMYDNEIDRLQQESDSKIEDLEDKWSDSKIAEIVAKSLGEGVFTDIDGEVHNLQDTLISFAEDSGEALGVLGDKIKNELSLNLQEALNYIKEYDEIINSMGLKQLGNINYSDKVTGRALTIDDISINVYGTEGMNERQLAEEVSRQIENKLGEITNAGLL